MLQYVKKNSDQVLFGIYVCTKNSNKLNTKKLVQIFNPNIRGIGEKSPTFGQNNFTP